MDAPAMTAASMQSAAKGCSLSQRTGWCTAPTIAFTSSTVRDRNRAVVVPGDDPRVLRKDDGAYRSPDAQPAGGTGGGGRRGGVVLEHHAVEAGGGDDDHD